MSQHVLFVPGTLCTEALFAPQIEFCSSSGLRCTTARLDGGDSMTKMAKAILADAPETFALVGLSMGGIIAFEIMRQAPERVERLALLDTNSRAETPEKLTARLAAIDAIDDLEMQGLDGLLPFVEYSLFPNYTAAYGADLKQHKEIVLKMAQDTGWQVGKAQMQALNTRHDSSELLSTIAVPTAVICGVEDKLCPVDRHLFMHEQIPGATLHILPDCGHLSTLEKPDQVNAILAEWLTR